MFLALTVFYALTGDIGIAIILLTLVIKTLLHPALPRARSSRSAGCR